MPLGLCQGDIRVGGYSGRNFFTEPRKQDSGGGREERGEGRGRGDGGDRRGERGRETGAGRGERGKGREERGEATTHILPGHALGDPFPPTGPNC